MIKPLELLVVEDNEKHLADARAYFAPIEQKGIVHVTYASTLKEVLDTEDNIPQNIQGVITDIFFPTGFVGARKKQVLNFLRDTLEERTISNDPEYTRKLMDSINSWLKGKTIPPSGVYLAYIVKMIYKGLPIVLNTDTYHHGDATQPVSTWANSKDIKLVETGKGDEPGKSKDWRGAYWIIAAEIETCSHPKKIVAYALDGTSLGLYFKKEDCNVQDTPEEIAEIKQLRQKIFEKYHIDKSGLGY